MLPRPLPLPTPARPTALTHRVAGQSRHQGARRHSLDHLGLPQRAPPTPQRPKRGRARSLRVAPPRHRGGLAAGAGALRRFWAAAVGRRAPSQSRPGRGRGQAGALAARAVGARRTRGRPEARGRPDRPERLGGGSDRAHLRRRGPRLDGQGALDGWVNRVELGLQRQQSAAESGSVRLGGAHGLHRPLGSLPRQAPGGMCGTKMAGPAPCGRAEPSFQKAAGNTRRHCARLAAARASTRNR